MKPVIFGVQMVQISGVKPGLLRESVVACLLLKAEALVSCCAFMCYSAHRLQWQLHSCIC